MTKDRGGWKRSLKLMAVGGTMLGMFWFPSISWESWGGLPSGGGLPGWGCGDNANFVTYFNTLGTTAISDISDRYFDDQVVNSDYDKFVREIGRAHV